MKRLNLDAAVLQTGDVPEEWTVEAIDMPEGDCYLATFSGPASREAAEEYARDRYSHFRVLSKEPLTLYG